MRLPRVELPRLSRSWSARLEIRPRLASPSLKRWSKLAAIRRQIATPPVRLIRPGTQSHRHLDCVECRPCSELSYCRGPLPLRGSRAAAPPFPELLAALVFPTGRSRQRSHSDALAVCAEQNGIGLFHRELRDSRGGYPVAFGYRRSSYQLAIASAATTLSTGPDSASFRVAVATSDGS